MMITINDKLTDSQFYKLSNFIQNNYGVKMPHQKKFMLQSRIVKRLKDLDIPTFQEYLDYLFDEKFQEEISQLIDVVTTHKTDFYREMTHFDFISHNFLKNNKNNNLRILSAGCSTGEEPYSLAITFLNSNIDNFNIDACDISKDCIRKASDGVYPINKVSSLSLDIKKQYFLKSKDDKTAKIQYYVKNYINYFQCNLLNYNFTNKYDLIMCRNTLIYFDRNIQEKVLDKLVKNLKKDGILIIGHSESIMNFNLPLKQIKPTIFRKI